MEVQSRTLPNLYKEVPSIEGKALAFLKDYINNGQSIRAVSRLLEIDRKTAGAILDELKESAVYKSAMEQVATNTEGFASTEFGQTIFQRYEIEIKELDSLIGNAEDSQVKASLMRMKHNLMRDQLKAMLFFRRNEGVVPPKDTPNMLDEMFNSVLQEARTEVH